MAYFIKYFLIAYFFVQLIPLAAQDITGVIMSTDGEPIAEAVVYYSGTSFSTKTNATGKFTLEKQENQSEIIISHPNYGIEAISHKEIVNNYIELFLSPKIELSATIATALSKADRNYALIKFRENLLGTSKNGLNCKILNEDDIQFQFSNNKHTIAAYAREPLIIHNKNLGYEIRYDLVTFELNQKENVLFYAGYPLFKPLRTKTKKRHIKNRQKAYNGSLQHFLHSIYANTFQEEGFQVRKIIRTRNPNYPSDSLYQAAAKAARETISFEMNSWYADVLYQARTQSKFVDNLYPQLLKREDFTRTEENKIYLSFDFYLDVEFTLEKEPLEYRQRLPSDQQQFIRNQTSRIWVTEDVEILKNGLHLPASALWTTEYLGFEKLGDMVPANYQRPL